LAASSEAVRNGVSRTFALLDTLAESVMAVVPVRDRGGKLADFAITHLSPGFADPDGREARSVAGLSLLEAYPGSATGGGLFARAAQVLADGRPQRIPGESGPLTGSAHAVPVADV